MHIIKALERVVLRLHAFASSLGTKWRWVASSIVKQLESLLSFNERLSGRHSKSGRFGEEESLLLLEVVEGFLGRPA